MIENELNSLLRDTEIILPIMGEELQREIKVEREKKNFHLAVQFLFVKFYWGGETTFTFHAFPICLIYLIFFPNILNFILVIIM